MRAALTVWDGRISPVFDVCREVLLIDHQGGVELSRELCAVPVTDWQAKIDRLAEAGVERVVCGAISGAAAEALRARGIAVLGFVAGEVPRVVRALLAGGLPAPAFAMPGCAVAQGGQPRRQRRRRRGRALGGRRR